MKKIFLTAGLLCIVFLNGCKSVTELGKNDIITSFYIDLNENLYEISAEILNFENEENSSLKTAYGESLALAYKNLIKSLEKPPYIGHAGTLIIGDGLCENSLYETINFFSDINMISPNINVMLTEDSFTDFKPNSIYDGVKNKTLTQLPLYTLFLPENETVFIPVISAFENEPQNTGGAIFKDFIYKYYISEEESVIYKLLTNNFQNDYYNSNELLKSKCKMKNKDGNLEIKLKLEIKNLTEKKNDLISEEIKNDTEDFIKKIKENNLCDLLKKGDFNSFETFIDITVPDMGKLKKQED